MKQINTKFGTIYIEEWEFDHHKPWQREEEDRVKIFDSNERYLASLLLANSSYRGEKYYEKEDEYTEIIKENKHLLSDNNEDGPIDEEEAFIWKVSYGEYELAEDGGIILDSTAASVFSVGELVKVVFEDEEDQVGIYRVVKVTDTQCVCEFVK